MSRQVWNNGETYGVLRGKLNANFLELYSDKLEASDVITRTNTSVFVPTTPYHPSTKSYTDSILALHVSTYDPDGHSINAFLRSNHTGMLDPSVITQTVDYRFSSDIEKSVWNGKEDSIGAKNTAFNKNFGTGVGTIAYGDHGHTGTYELFNSNIQNHIATTSGNPHSITKAEIILGNCDNTADIDKTVSNNFENGVISSGNYNPSILTTDKIIQITDCTSDRTVIISNEDIASGTTVKLRKFDIVKKNSDSGKITVSLENGGTISGEANQEISGDYDILVIRIDGTNAF